MGGGGGGHQHLCLLPFSQGKVLLLLICLLLISLAPSYSSHATLAAGEVAELAEERKCTKYNSLPVTHSFTPVAIDTSGVIGPKSLVFLKELGRRVRRHTKDERATSYLLQRISVAIQ